MDRITCHVWVGDTGLARDWHRTLLDAVERERRAGIRQIQDRVRFTTAAALLRLAVGARTATPPTLVDATALLGGTSARRSEAFQHWGLRVAFSMPIHGSWWCF